MQVAPVFGERALRADPGGVPTLVVGDLHVGLEGDLHRAGVHLPSQTERMRTRLQRLVLQAGVEHLVVLGDLKHSVARATRQEEDELPGFFEGVGAEVHLVPGNHDGGVEALLAPDVTVHDAAGIALAGELGLVHGHAWPADAVMACPVVVVCHNHPTVLLVDELGHRHKEPCWARTRFTDAARDRYPDLPAGAECILAPAFNELLGGTALNAREGGSLLGPLAANGFVDVDGARVHTLDGMDLGRVAELRRFGDVEQDGDAGPGAGAEVDAGG